MNTCHSPPYSIGFRASFLLCGFFCAVFVLGLALKADHAAAHGTWQQPAQSMAKQSAQPSAVSQSAPLEQTKLVSRVGPASHIRIASGLAGGEWYLMGTALAELFSANALPATNRSGTSTSNIKSVLEGRADIAFSIGCLLSVNANPVSNTPKKKLPVILTPLYEQILYILVRQEIASKYNIGSLGDLLAVSAPLRFATLRQGTSTEMLVSLVLEQGYGISLEKLRAKGWRIVNSGFVELADNFVSGKIDAIMLSSDHDSPLLHTIEGYVQMNFLPVEKDVLEKLRNHFGTSQFTLMPDHYASLAAPVTTLSDATVLVTRSNFPDELVRQIIQILVDNRQKLVALDPDLGFIAKENMPHFFDRMHPAATAFWQEQP